MLVVLLLSTIAICLASQPTCPNGQFPKRDNNNKLVQCLPGSMFSDACGSDHKCFFSGMNYMCCPSNEPSPTNQPTCPTPLMTVLGSSGFPLKCSALTRRCPKDNMYCLDVGLDFICCEKSSETTTAKPATTVSTLISNNGQPIKLRKVIRKTPACPKNTLGVIGETGGPLRCNTDEECGGPSQFCFGKSKRICCEKILTLEEIVHVKEKVSDQELKKVKPSSESLINKKITIKSHRISETRTIVDRSPVLEDETPAPLIVFTTTVPTTTTTKLPVRTRTPTRVASRRLNGVRNLSEEDKRSMTQQLLMEQIRNGWPYDDRFYRPAEPTNAENNIRL